MLKEFSDGELIYTDVKYFTIEVVNRVLQLSSSNNVNLVRTTTNNLLIQATADFESKRAMFNKFWERDDISTELIKKQKDFLEKKEKELKQLSDLKTMAYGWASWQELIEASAYWSKM